MHQQDHANAGSQAARTTSFELPCKLRRFSSATRSSNSSFWSEDLPLPPDRSCRLRLARGASKSSRCFCLSD